MAHFKAPKQWVLTKNETITSFQNWKQNIEFQLGADPDFARFLVPNVTWTKKSPLNPTRGFVNDPAGPEAVTAVRKAAQLELMLGQIANFCPVISRNTIVKDSTSMNSIWQAIRLHYGFQSTGAQFLDLCTIKLESMERPEDLYQRLKAFFEDNLLQTSGSIRHMNELPRQDEEMSPTLENTLVALWLKLIDDELPKLVKQRYATELRSHTLATIKPEISLALDSLLDELHSNRETRVMRSFMSPPARDQSRKPKVQESKSCPICKQAGRSKYKHFLSSCPYLPEADRRYLTKARQTVVDPDSEEESEEDPSEANAHTCAYTSSTRRVTTGKSPTFRAFSDSMPVIVTVDCGSESNMIRESTARRLNVTIKKTQHKAVQADGCSSMKVVGEICTTFLRDGIPLYFDAIVVDDLDSEILGGIPFMEENDIYVRPKQKLINIQDKLFITYTENTSARKGLHHVRRTSNVIRAEKKTVVWPGGFVEATVPEGTEPDSVIAIEPHHDPKGKSWIKPDIMDLVGTKLRIHNNTQEPQLIIKNEHLCHMRETKTFDTCNLEEKIIIPKPAEPRNSSVLSSIQLDPDNIIPINTRHKFNDLLQTCESVFSPVKEGYNGNMGPIKAVVNMGPTEPPQRKGRIPQYARNNLLELQKKFDTLEAQGVFAKPDTLGITVEYLNPSFLVKKANGDFRLVTAFTEVAKYSKPQPSLMPDIDSTLRTIAKWKYIIVSDLSSAFYQIPLSRDSMKYCGVATPFRGIRVYTRSAMGMPGSETALEELMSRVLGDCVQDGIVTKLADDLYCGANTLDELYSNFSRVLQALDHSNIKLSPKKTVICPKSTSILGWVWHQGSLSASPHKIAVLSSCPKPTTVKEMRSFIGAYKILGRVLPGCSTIVAPLDEAIAGLESRDKVEWTEALHNDFTNAQNKLTQKQSVVLPRPEDPLWIVTDGSVMKSGIGATLYVLRNDKLLLAGFFSAKLKKHQVKWLPCEVEALGIAASIKHFSPFIIQSEHPTTLLTDSKPCVQAIEKLCRGEFSASPRVTSFLSIVSRYQVQVNHIPGSANLVSDFASRNAPECEEPNCQICKFIESTESSVVRNVNVQDILQETTRLPFTTRSAWLEIQNDCPDLRRVHAHLKQGTRPSKKLTNIRDIKRYLHVATIARDGLLVVKKTDPFAATKELILVPRAVLDGLLTALHIKLGHPSKHQLLLVMKRYFYALDIERAVETCTSACHICASMQKCPNLPKAQTTEEPPDRVGQCFAADVMKRSKQLILIVRETSSSYTKACLIPDETKSSLREGMLLLCLDLIPLEGPRSSIRVDPAPGFASLNTDETLQGARINIEIGRHKNPNKNPVAEKAVAEVEEELVRLSPAGEQVSPIVLAKAIARLNARIRSSGLSAREMLFQRDQFSNVQIPVADLDIIRKQHERRLENHLASEKSKCPTQRRQTPTSIQTGDLVYIHSDRDKTKARDRYLVTKTDGEWCYLKKFTGNQLRSSSYKCKMSECYKSYSVTPRQSRYSETYDSESDTEAENHREGPVPSASLPHSTHIQQDIVDGPTFDDTYSTMDSAGSPDLEPQTSTQTIETSAPVPTFEESQAFTKQPIHTPSRQGRRRQPPAYLKDYELY